MKKYTIDQNGRSMIEMLGVLAIVGVLSVAGIAGYSKAMAKYKVNKVMDQVSTLAANTKTLFASVGSYGGLAGADGSAIPSQRAYQLGLFPEDMVKACSKTGAKFATAAASGTQGQQDYKPATNTCVTNGMNGESSISPSADGKSFKIAMTGLTKEACTALMTSDWGGAAGFRGIAGTTAADDCATVIDDDTLCSPAELTGTGVYSIARDACTSADANTVIWYFY